MKQLAYLGVYELGGGAFAGGLLVCDNRGLPVDFRYVEPIKPTQLQRLIYGEALRRYVMVEAIGAGLLKDCEANYSVAFVDDELLFELLERCKAPIIKLVKSSRQPLDEMGKWENNGHGIEFQAADGESPVSLSFPEGAIVAVDDFMKDLAGLSETLNILEPIERVKKAVVEVGKMNGGEK
jgi:hypothetical protein